jgi:hypothetical protein
MLKKGTDYQIQADGSILLFTGVNYTDFASTFNLPQDSSYTEQWIGQRTEFLLAGIYLLPAPVERMPNLIWEENAGRYSVSSVQIENWSNNLSVPIAQTGRLEAESTTSNDILNRNFSYDLVAPNLYAINSLDDFFQYFWVAHGRDPENYSRADGESFYYSEVERVLKENLLMRFAPMLGPTVMPFVAVEQSENLLYEVSEQMSQWADVLQYAQAREEGLIDADYSQFNPNLMEENFYEQNGSVDDIHTSLMNAIMNIISNLSATPIKDISGFLEFWGLENIGSLSDLYTHFEREFGENYPIGQLLSFSQAFSDDFLQRSGYLNPQSYDEFLTYGDRSSTGIPDSISTINELNQDYEDAIALDMLRTLIYDPTWDPEKETADLATLQNEINKMVTSIVGVDISWVKKGFQDYHDILNNMNNWRLKMKPYIVHIDREAQRRRTLGETLEPWWWLAELVVSILFEPIDWLLTARDLLKGEWIALIGLIPLIPSALLKIGKGAKLLVRSGFLSSSVWTAIITQLRSIDDLGSGINRSPNNQWAESLVLNSRIPIPEGETLSLNSLLAVRNYLMTKGGRTVIKNGVIAILEVNDKWIIGFNNNLARYVDKDFMRLREKNHYAHVETDSTYPGWFGGHAESNILRTLGQDSMQGLEGKMFVTYAPCRDCYDISDTPPSGQVVAGVHFVGLNRLTIYFPENTNLLKYVPLTENNINNIKLGQPIVIE